MKEIKIKNIDEIIYEFKTKCGLKVFIWPYDLTEEIALSLTVNYGSIHTDFKVNNKTYHVPNGMAHFLEHIKFNEKKGITAHEYFNKLGSYVNAYTTYDHTSYEVTCNENVSENINHLLYFVLNPYFTKALVSKEKGIIVEEAKMTLDNPYNVGYQKLLNNLYITDHKKNLVTGNVDEIKSITIDDAKCIFDNFYHPENMFLTVTGNVNPNEIEKIVYKYFEKKEYQKYDKPVLLNKKESNKINKAYEEIKTTVVKENILLGFKIPKKEFKEFDDLHLRVYFNLIMSLNFGVTSLFNEELIKKDLIDNLYFNVIVDNEQIVVIFESTTAYPEKVCDLIKNKFRELSVLEEDFSRKVKVLIADSILGYEDPSQVNTDIRMNIINYDKIITNYDEIFSKLKCSDANNIIKKIIDYEVVVVIMNPKK